MKISMTKKEAEKIRDIFLAASKLKPYLPICYLIKIEAGYDGVLFTIYSRNYVDMFITYKSSNIEVAEQGSCLVNYAWFISKIVKFGFSTCMYNPETLKFDICSDNISTGCIGDGVDDFPSIISNGEYFETLVEHININPFINASHIADKKWNVFKPYLRDIFIDFKKEGQSKISGTNLFVAYSEEVVADCDFYYGIDREVFDLMYKNVADNIFSLVGNSRKRFGLVSREVSYYFSTSRNEMKLNLDQLLPESYDIQFTVSSECFRKIKGDDVSLIITPNSVSVNGNVCNINHIKYNINEPSVVFILSNDKDRGMVDRLLKVLPKKETELVVRIKDKIMNVEYDQVNMLFYNQNKQ